MPSKSQAQRRFMQAVAHSPEFAKKVGVPQSVGEEFNAADERHPGKKLPKYANKKRNKITQAILQQQRR